MSRASPLPPSPFHHLVEYGFSIAEGGDDLDHSEIAFASTMNRVFERLLGHAGDPVWLGIVETLEPGSSAWMEVFSDAVVSLAPAANWWPGTERLSLGDTRVRAVPAAAFGWSWQRICELVGEGFYPAFDPFLFSRHPGGDLCRIETVGHEGIATCRVPEADAATGRWLESLRFVRAEHPWEAPTEGEPHRLCGVRSRAELVEIFGEELVSSLDERASRKQPR
jgi:hypothetical protein